MNTRRNRKKVDYSKFCGAAESDEDDDFQDSPNNSSSKKIKSSDESLQPDKSKKEKKPIEKKKKQDVGNKENVKEVNEVKAKGRRNTRVSNAEEIYDKDILTAIEVSKSASPGNPPVTVISEDEDLVDSLIEECISKKSTSLKRAQLYKSDLIDNEQLESTIPLDSLEPQLSSTRRIDRKPMRKSSKSDDNDDWCGSDGEEDEDSDFEGDESDDEVHFSPVKKKAKTESSNTKPSTSKPKGDNNKKSIVPKNSVTATTASSSLPKSKPISVLPKSKPISMKTSATPKADTGKSNAFKSPTLNYASSSAKNSPLTSLMSPSFSSGGRLRLGLSRNKRIAKPLHSNISMKSI